MPTRRTGLAALVLIAVSTWSATADNAPPPAMIDLTGAARYEPLVGSEFSRIPWGDVELAWWEIAERGGARGDTRLLDRVRSWPEVRRPVLAAGLRQKLREARIPLAGRLTDTPESHRPEGFEIVIDPAIPAVVVAGNDARGIIFGLGRLLREVRADHGRMLLPSALHVVSAPRQSLRGHQLGYRPKTNAYDAWDEKTWANYIRDLAFFGTNAIEVLPPRTDDDADSPHFPAPPLEMMAFQAIAASHFDMAVWIWFPVMDPVDTHPEKAEPLLKEWDEVFRKLRRLDAVFVPGGDPGHIAPKPLFAFLQRAKAVLAKSHPKAQMWVSPQGFDAGRVEEFLALVKTEPKWLDGIVFGPQVRVPLAELRKILPARLPIRGYPDITHCRQCQHPVPDWDLAFAVTEGRESINPRPLAMARLLQAYEPHTVGFISYSEGCNDDVNKFVWSAMASDRDAEVVDVLRQYARYFIGAEHEDAFAQALLGLERNWSGPLLTNTGVESTLATLRDMDRSATPRDLLNWRFQQALYRGYYDAYVRDRLVQETALQAEVHDTLRQARRLGSLTAIDRARSIFDRSATAPVSLDRRARVFELGEALYQSIHMQLSKPKYQAIDPERGANLDTIDTPLNDRTFFRRWSEQLARGETTEEGRLAAIQQLLDEPDAGPGGFYDDLGDPGHSPHLVREPAFEADPFLLRAAYQGFMLSESQRLSRRTFTQTFHDAPLRLRYEGLDREARYVLRVAYTGDSPQVRIRLVADGLDVHPLMNKAEASTRAFPVPAQATADGRLELSWTVEPGRGGNGRGCEVAEVWLMRAEWADRHAR